MLTLGKALAVWVAALVACVCGLYPVAALGLSVPGSVALPLAMAAGGLLAALAATWVGGVVFAENGSRSRLLPVVGVTEIAALVLAGVVLALVLLGVLAPLVVFLLASAALIAGTATWAARRLRTAHPHPLRDAGVSVALVAVAVLVVAGGVPALCSTVLTCAP